MQLSKERGFSLVGTMIALLVVGMAITGLIRSQLAMNHAEKQLATKAAAMRLASELADWIRALPETAVSEHFDAITAFFDQASDNPAVSCFYTDCQPDQQIRFDLSEWRQRLIAALPHAQVVLCRDASYGTAKKIPAVWECAEPENTDAPVVIKMGWHSPVPAQNLPQLVMMAGRIGQ